MDETGKSHWKKSVRSKESLQTRLLTTRPASPQSWFPYENPRGEDEAQSGPWIFHKQCIIAPSTSSCTNTWLQRYMFVGRSVPNTYISEESIKEIWKLVKSINMPKVCNTALGLEPFDPCPTGAEERGCKGRLFLCGQSIYWNFFIYIKIVLLV